MSTTALPARRAPDSFAILLMIGLCAIWGLQQVAIKSTNAALPPVFQAGLRSAIAAVLVWGWARSRGTPLFRDDGTLGAGLLAGVLFAGEFVCIFLGLTLTSASRMAVFLYTAPCFTALGLHWFVDGERMRRIQWAGIVVAFAGIALAFADGFLHGHAAQRLDAQGRGRRRARRAGRHRVGRDHSGGARHAARPIERQQDAALSIDGVRGGVARAGGRARPGARRNRHAAP